MKFLVGFFSLEWMRVFDFIAPLSYPFVPCPDVLDLWCKAFGVVFQLRFCVL